MINPIIEIIIKHKQIVVLAIAAAAIASYMIPFSNFMSAAKAQDGPGYKGKFPGGGATGGVFPGKGPCNGNKGLA